MQNTFMYNSLFLDIFKTVSKCFFSFQTHSKEYSTWHIGWKIKRQLSICRQRGDNNLVATRWAAYECMIDWRMDRLADNSTYWLTGVLNDRVSEWLSDQLSVQDLFLSWHLKCQNASWPTANAFTAAAAVAVAVVVIGSLAAHSWPTLAKPREREIGRVGARAADAVEDRPPGCAAF